MSNIEVYVCVHLIAILEVLNTPGIQGCYYGVICQK